MNPTSFMSEHTAEYALVCNIVTILSRDHTNVIPIYFWATREGASMAMNTVGSCKVRIVTAYARRPKVIDPSGNNVLMKINSLLLKAGAMGIETGSPVFAGVPLATGLLQYSLNTPCCWFHLRSEVCDDRDIHIKMSLSGQIQSEYPDHSSVVGPLAPEEILALVKQHTRPMRWDEAVDCIRRVRSCGEIGIRAFYFSAYRPFFVILPEEGTRETI